MEFSNTLGKSLASTSPRSGHALQSLTKKERYLRALSGLEVDRPPVWIMRQAGRYLASYQAIRSGSTFGEMIATPDIAARVTILPLEAIDPDALIVFNDILVPLDDMGCGVRFTEAGPIIDRPARRSADLEEWYLPVDYSAPGAEPIVAETLRQVRSEVGLDVPVLGFAGAPFTMAAYAIEGKMSRQLDAVKRMRFERATLLHRILGALSETIASYLIAQIQLGGADAVQLFDTWAESLSPACYLEFVDRYQRDVIARVRAACPTTPITLFLRGGWAHYADLRTTGATAISLDWRHSLAQARAALGPDIALQGNLDPLALNAPPEEIAEHFMRSIQDFDPYRGYVANLGHGVLPTTPVEGVRALVEAIKTLATASPEEIE